MVEKAAICLFISLLAGILGFSGAAGALTPVAKLAFLGFLGAYFLVLMQPVRRSPAPPRGVAEIF